MADQSTLETAPADKPLAELAAAEAKVNPPIVAVEAPATISLEPGTTPPGWTPQPEPMSAVDRLRAFEDTFFGKKAVRINGRVERGFGSPYQMAKPATRKAHAALENLIDVEQKLAAAHSALIAADVENDAAQKTADDAEQEANAAAND